MAEPIREQILAAVTTQLGTIVAGVTVGDYVYALTPVVVSRVPLAAKQYEDELRTSGGPILGVTRGSESLLTVQAHRTDGAAPFIDEFRFLVVAYVRAIDGVLAGTLLERAWEDHVRCLREDPTLTGLIDDLRPELTETDDGELEPEGWFRQRWVAEVVRDL